MQTGSQVVLYRGAVKTRHKRLREQFLALHSIGIQGAGAFVEAGSPQGFTLSGGAGSRQKTGEHQHLRSVVYPQLAAFALQQQRTAVAEQQLVIGQLPVRREQSPGPLEHIAHREGERSGNVVHRADAQVQLRGPLRTDNQVLYYAGAYGNAIGLQAPEQTNIGQIPEEIFVMDG